MCGRFSLDASPEDMIEEFDLHDAPAWPARYNIAPTQQAPIVTLAPDGASRVAFLARWGLIPSWAKDPEIGSRLINARSESAAEKPAFRGAFRMRRCMIPASGFFEWGLVEGKKTPWFFHLPGRRVFGMAGLWEQWRDSEGRFLQTCAILTTDANALVGALHNRMPVILDRADYAAWLDVGRTSRERVRALLSPYPSDQMRSYAVSRLVNNPRNDTPACVAPSGA